jgi:OmcA/MtrC family decaheme c-type cytochrome
LIRRGVPGREYSRWECKARPSRPESGTRPSILRHARPRLPCREPRTICTRVDGTYRLSLWGNLEKLCFPAGQPLPHLLVSPAATADLRFGSASTIEPHALISAKEDCYACHQDIWYHEGAVRGFDARIACHGNAGSEDLPRYVAANARPTPGVSVNFRTLLHRIHRGSQLSEPFSVMGSGTSAYPDNYAAHTYSQILSPAMPGGTRSCEKCHGLGNSAWIQPADRDHPTQQQQPVRAWKAACGTCHDSGQALGHIDLQTMPSGLEVCGVCHDPGQAFEVELAHKAR